MKNNFKKSDNKEHDIALGEVVLKSGTDGVFVLTHGFHQTNWNLLVMEDHNSAYNTTIFPNSTTKFNYHQDELTDIL